jgi:hypothetical protein
MLKILSVMALAAGTLGLRGAGGTIEEASAGAYRAAFACFDKCEDDLYTHRFNGFGAILRCEPNTCHPEWNGGACTAYHYVCGGDTFYENGGFGRIERALAAGDWQDLRQMQRKVGTVRFNSSRNSLQVEDCDHHVVANYELPLAAGRILTED